MRVGAALLISSSFRNRRLDVFIIDYKMLSWFVVIVFFRLYLLA